MGSSNPFLERAYRLDGNKEHTRSFYADWAENYDHDTCDEMGYVAPAIAANALIDHIEVQGEILDAGCGTGLVAEQLKSRNELTIDGIDLSPGMLKQARQKNLYRRLREADLSGPLAIEDNRYDAVISVGVFTSGHVGPEALLELTRVAKPGAPIVVTVHEQVWEKDAYLRQLARMKGQNLISLCDITTAPYHQHEGHSCQLCVMRAA